MSKLQWGDRVMLLFLNGKSDGDGDNSCGGAAVKKEISSRGVDNKCNKDENVLPPVPSPRPVKKKTTSKGVDNKRSKDGNVLPPVPSPRPVKKKNTSKEVDNKRSKDGKVLPPVPSPRPAKKKNTSKGVDNKRSKDGNVLPLVPSPCPVKKKITSKGVDNKRTKDGNVLPPVPSPHPCNSENPRIMETRVYSRKKIKLKDEDCRIDQISRLPDELLVSILSCLSLKEAAVSSILSRRWRFLWTFTSKLDFEGSDLWTSFTSKPDFDIFCPPSQSKREASIRECWEYVRWVNHVLGLRNKSAAIEELRISFSLNEAHKSYIDRWINLALARKVVRLDMNLVQTYFPKQLYTFPYKLLCNTDSHSWGFKGLRLIRMVSVDLSDGALEIFLRSCPLLEEIFFADCWGISTVKIVNSLPALKRLTLVGCAGLKSVEVCDSNFVYFMYRGLLRPLEHFVLKNVPLLVEINVGGPVTENVEEFLAMFSSCLPQLEKLTIHRRMTLSILEADMICSSVKMSNLKQLVWKFVGFYPGLNDLEGVTILVGASPLLQRLVLMSHGDVLKGSADHFYNLKKSYRRTHAYSHLKRVEFVGYHGEMEELAILLHFLEHAAGLEEVIIHPAKETCIDYMIGEYTEQEIDAFRSLQRFNLLLGCLQQSRSRSFSKGRGLNIYSCPSKFGPFI